MSKMRQNLAMNLDQAITEITTCVRAGIVPMLHGSPGLGKSAIIKKMAEDLNLELIDIRLSQCDPTDLMGFPSVVDVKDPTSGEVVTRAEGQAQYPLRRAEYVPMSIFPTEDTPLPEGKDGWVIFLDEFPSASMSVQAAAYKIVLDREVGPHKLHKRVAMVCAGNLSTDGAIVNRQSTAMQSRLAHLYVDVDVNSWVQWATASGIDHRIVSHIRNSPKELYQFKADHDDVTFRCPRTWEFVSKALAAGAEPNHSRTQLLSGLIGEAGARMFIGYCAIYQDLVSIEEILANPEKCRVPDEKSTQFATAGMLANAATKENMEILMKYIDRLPREFQVIFAQDTVARDPMLAGVPSFMQWMTEAGEEIFD